MVMEAVAIKVKKEDYEAEKQQQTSNWKKDTSSLKQFT